MLHVSLALSRGGGLFPAFLGMASNGILKGGSSDSEDYVDALTEEGKATIMAMVQYPKFFNPETGDPESLKEYTDRNVLEYAKTVTFGLNLLDIAQNGQDMESLYCTATKMKNSIKKYMASLPVAPPAPPTSKVPDLPVPDGRRAASQKGKTAARRRAHDGARGVAEGKRVARQKKRPVYSPVTHSKAWGRAKAPKEPKEPAGPKIARHKSESSSGVSAPMERASHIVEDDSDDARMHVLLGKLHGIERLINLVGLDNERAQSVLGRAKVLEGAIMDAKTPQSRASDLSLLQSDLNILNRLLSDGNNS